MADLPTLEDLKTGSDLFPGARSPRGARAGLLLRHGQWDDAHAVAQDLATAEGSFWHGIVHRHEPDPANAGYWFRRVGYHPVFPALRTAVREIEKRYPACRLGMGTNWDPFVWIDFWERSRRSVDPAVRQMADDVDAAEWEILFGYCVEPLR